jgi:hypothetical protein
VCEVDPLTIRGGMLVRDHELKDRLGCRSCGEIFTVVEDSPREKEGPQ